MNGQRTFILAIVSMVIAAALIVLNKIPADQGLGWITGSLGIYGFKSVGETAFKAKKKE
jgi:hypothetical protein